MSVVGIGVDIQSISELARHASLASPDMFFTDEEQHYCHRAASPAATRAGLVCAKEALYKALPPVRPLFFWTDMEIRHAPGGAPYVALRGQLADLQNRYGWAIWLSISHSIDYATAIALVTRE